MEPQIFKGFQAQGESSAALTGSIAGTPSIETPKYPPLPEFHEPYIDRYFLRAAEILRAEGLNPWVRAQVFIRKGPGEVHGIDEAAAIIGKYSSLKEHGGSVFALPEGAPYNPGDTVMVLEGPLQDIVELETMYLGVITAETTKASDKIAGIDLASVTRKMRLVVEAAQNRPVMYMGARHWRYDEDAAISLAAFEGGAADCSTEIGAATAGKKAAGTIPHILENAYALLYGKERGVLESALAFDRVIDPAVPRIALVDYHNREVDDSLAVARALGERLFAVRVDTCGENIMQGALTLDDLRDKTRLPSIWRGIALPDAESPSARYWYGNGVTVSGVYALRLALNEAGFDGVRIVLSSGFGDVEKIKAFTQAEEQLGVRLFDMLGVGGVFPARYATMDVVAAGHAAPDMRPLSKTGRKYRPNAGLVEVI